MAHVETYPWSHGSAAYAHPPQPQQQRRHDRDHRLPPAPIQPVVQLVRQSAARVGDRVVGRLDERIFVVDFSLLAGGRVLRLPYREGRPPITPTLTSRPLPQRGSRWSAPPAAGRRCRRSQTSGAIANPSPQARRCRRRYSAALQQGVFHQRPSVLRKPLDARRAPTLPGNSRFCQIGTTITNAVDSHLQRRTLGASVRRVLPRVPLEPPENEWRGSCRVF